MQINQLSPCFVHHSALLVQSDHRVVKLLQLMVLQLRIVCQAPLSAAILEAVAVAFPGEVNPLRMSEFVAHKVQISVAARRHRHQTNHFVQFHGPLDRQTRISYAHVPVHLLIRQPEHDRFIPHQRLIMRFTVADGLFTGAPGRQFIPHLPDIPVLVLDLGNRPDPIIRQSHAEPIIKAHAAFPNRQAHSRHAAHILRDCHRVLTETMHQIIGQLQIGDRLRIRIHAEILFVAVKHGPQSMIPVQHRCHPIKTEPVKMVLFHPVFQV